MRTLLPTALQVCLLSTTVSVSDKRLLTFRLLPDEPQIESIWWGHVPDEYQTNTLPGGK